MQSRYSIHVQLAGAALALALAAGCSPKPPPQSAAVGPSPAVSGGSPAAVSTDPVQTASPGASPAATGAADGQKIVAVSRGSGDQPARYTVRNPNGQIQYDVRSTTVVYDRAPDGTSVATFARPDVIFHDRTGHTMLATAPKAVAHDKDKSVVMSGGVHAKTDDGKVLTCDTMTYDAKHDQIRSDGHVILTNTKTNQSASGESLTSDLGFEHMTLSGNR